MFGMRKRNNLYCIVMSYSGEWLIFFILEKCGTGQTEGKCCKGYGKTGDEVSTGFRFVKNRLMPLALKMALIHTRKMRTDSRFSLEKVTSS